MKAIRSAFTLLELVFVIVAIGIIAAVLIPRMNDDVGLHNAAKQVVSDIRYTQHLAMNDDVLTPGDNNWFKKRWTIIFNSDAYSNNQFAYTIFSDSAGTSTGNPDLSEIARSPIDNTKYMSGGYSNGLAQLDIRSGSFAGMKELNLGMKYSITNVVFSASCSVSGSRRIAFDHMGRPLIGNLSSYTSAYPAANRLLTQTCTITLTDSSGKTINIYIEPETGYTHL